MVGLSYYTSPMAMGKRKRDRQPAMWVPTTDLPTAASHPFYRRLNQLLRQHGFDDFAETQCATFYAETMGRPGLAPGVYFRLLLIGCFEGIDSERPGASRADRERTPRPPSTRKTGRPTGGARSHACQSMAQGFGMNSCSKRRTA